MAATNYVVNVAGVADVNLGLGGTNQTLIPFGRTQNGVTIVTEGHQISVPGDENGGDEGPPVEIQFIGETARVRLEFTKWNKDYEHLLRGRMFGSLDSDPQGAGIAGSGNKVVGTLLFANNLFHRVCIICGLGNEVHNFPCGVLVRTPIEKNVGTKFSRLVVEYECYKHPTTGVLENAVSS